MKFSFELQPHDSASDDALFEVVTRAKWRGKKYGVGLGESHHSEETSVLVIQRSGKPLLRAVEPICSIHWLYEAANEKVVGLADEAHDLKAMFRETGKHKTWARLFYLNDQLQLRQSGEEARFAVLLSGQGWAKWRVLERTQNGHSEAISTAHFRWKPANKKTLRRATSLDLWQPLRVELNLSGSHIEFARRFIELSADEKHHLLWRYRNGNQRELKVVLRDLLLAQPDWWKEPRHVSWHFDYHDRFPTRYSCDDKPIPQLTKVFERSLKKVWKWFDPVLDKKDYKRHLELQRYWDNTLDSIPIKVNEPTAHEQLEAALRFREWEQTHRD